MGMASHVTEKINYLKWNWYAFMKGLDLQSLEWKGLSLFEPDQPPTKFPKPVL